MCRCVTRNIVCLKSIFITCDRKWANFFKLFWVFGTLRPKMESHIFFGRDPVCILCCWNSSKVISLLWCRFSFQAEKTLSDSWWKLNPSVDVVSLRLVPKNATFCHSCQNVLLLIQSKIWSDCNWKGSNLSLL